MTQQTEINQFVDAINKISSVREYDLSILEVAQHNNNLAFWAIIISLSVALITVITTIYIFRRQENIIKKQLEVSSQQNKIALFDKRFHIFSLISQIYINIIGLPNLKDAKQSHKTPENISILLLKYFFHNIIINPFSRETPFQLVILHFQGETGKILTQLNSTQFMFYLDDKQKKSLKKLTQLVTDFSLLLFDYAGESEDTLIFAKILEIKNFYEKSCFIGYLKKQVYISDDYK